MSLKRDGMLLGVGKVGRYRVCSRQVGRVGSFQELIRSVSTRPKFLKG